MTVRILADALGDTRRYFEALPDIAEQAAILAVNQVTQRTGIARMQREMEQQVAFPKDYVRRKDRLWFKRAAKKGDITAVIAATDRPTSLARFAQGQTPENTKRGGVRVIVKPGKTVHLQKAFLVRLRNGNIGLAVRLKPGQRLAGSDSAVELAPNVWLLYGPSIDQVFMGVADDTAPDMLNQISREFFRQFERLSR